MITDMTIGIIGYGKFTELMVEHLGLDFEVFVYSRRNEPGVSKSARFQFASVQDTLACDIIIISIPAQYFEDFFSKYASLCNPEALVIDVASIKEAPIAVMEKYLPETAKILGTHPIFGPGSAKNGLNGLQVVVCPVRNISTELMQSVRQYLEQKGLVVLERTPKEHDDGMAYVLGLTHIIGRSMDAMNIPDLEFTTPSYEDLLDMRNIQGKDSWDLFLSIQSTPQALSVLKQFRQEVDTLLEQLDSK